MSGNKINVGIIGLKPGESWAGVSHVPALKENSGVFNIAGVANSNLESSRAAAGELGIPHAFANAEELISSPEIDAVTVTITVPQHLKVVKKAIDAGKHIYCEAPLGNGLAEAEELAKLARGKDIVTVVGLQARVAPEILFLREKINKGSLGTILSSNLSGWGGNWGPTAENISRLGYLLDKNNGATMLTIPLGHTLAAVRDVLGNITDISSILDTRISEVKSLDDGQMLKMTAPDQILVNGRFENGAPFSVHYQGGMPNGIDGFIWDIHGTKKDIRVTAPFGHAQMAQLSIFEAEAGSGKLNPVSVSDQFNGGYKGEPVPGNVVRNYARMGKDILTGSNSASNFDDAVGIQRLIDAIERSSVSGERIVLEPVNRPLPITF